MCRRAPPLSFEPPTLESTGPIPPPSHPAWVPQVAPKVTELPPQPSGRTNSIASAALSLPSVMIRAIGAEELTVRMASSKEETFVSESPR